MTGSPLPFAQAIEWLSQHDDPAVRYLTLRDLSLTPVDDSALASAKQDAHSSGIIATILDAMAPEGYWARPGAGYTPKYRATTWSLLTLAQCGASVDGDERIATACNYLLDHALCSGGRFSVNGQDHGNLDCLHGNMCAALMLLGCDDPRLETAYEWAARSITGEGVAPFKAPHADLTFTHYNREAGFICRANAFKPCAWGAVKLMWAFSLWPTSRHTPLIDAAIQQGADFLFAADPVTATYPNRNDGDPPSKLWWQFGFPVFYRTDLLQLAEGLVGLGYGTDPRLKNLLDMIAAKADTQGRWALEYKYYTDEIWCDVGRRNAANPWVTIRSMRVLHQAGIF